MYGHEETKRGYSASFHERDDTAYIQLYLRGGKVAAIAYSGDKVWTVAVKNGWVQEITFTRNKVTSELLEKGFSEAWVKPVLDRLKQFPGSDSGLAG